MSDRDPLEAFVRLLLLTPLQRERWVDHRVVGLTHKQIADRDGISRSAVYLSIKHADRILRRDHSRQRQAA